MGLALILILQCGIILLSFRSLDDLTNDRPIINIDFCSQYYWAQAAREFEARSDRLWGYDPYFMAGYPLDFLVNSALPVQLVAAAGPSLNLARVIKACFVISFALVPLTLFFALRHFGLKPWPALMAAAAGATYFWLGENALFGRFGMISGAFLLHFFLVPLSLLLSFLREKKTATLVLLFLAMPLAFIIHKTAFVLVLPVAGLWIAYYWRSISLRDLGKLAAVFVLTILVNLFWLWPFFRFLGLKVEDPATTYFQNLEALRWITDLVPFQTFFGLPLIRLLILGTGLLGLCRMRRDEKNSAVPILLALAFFGLLAYFGSFIPPLRHLQPYRYVTAYFYLWLPFSGSGLLAIQDKVSALRGGRILGPVILALILIGLLRAPSFNTFAVVSPLKTDLDRDSQALIAWVKANTDRSARLLIEDIKSWEGQPIYGGARLPHLLPGLVPRELIGGPLTNAFILHHWATFQDGRLLNAPIADYPDPRLEQVFSLYNIGWAVCWSEPAKARFRKYPGAAAAANFGELAVFIIRRDHNFFLEGAGRVQADFDRIELSGLTTEGGRVVVSYHWVEGLRAEPPAGLTRVMVGDDPVGFIGLQRPPAAVTIRLGP